MSGWWRARSLREQMLIAIMGLMLAIVLGWLLVARPLAGALETAHARQQAAAVALGEARARSAQAREASGVETASPPLPIAGLVQRSAADSGFPAARVEAQGTARARLAIQAARPQALFGWIATLQARGIVVESLQARANLDHTVSVEAVLKARGSA
jgi:general secretion pathway protein M